MALWYPRESLARLLPRVRNGDDNQGNDRISFTLQQRPNQGGLMTGCGDGEIQEVNTRITERDKRCCFLSH